MFSYTEPLDQSLVQYVRDQLGKWTSDNMHTLLGGMHSLPDSFFGPNGLDVEADVKFNKPVSKISYSCMSSKPNSDFVKVTCYSNNIEPESNYTARASLSIIIYIWLDSRCFGEWFEICIPSLCTTHGETKNSWNLIISFDGIQC